jgi:hypothetical protein
MAAGYRTKSPSGCNVEDVALDVCWRSSPVIECWCDALLHLTGCAPGEVADKVDVLLGFCAEQRLLPEALIVECRCGAERMARRAFYLKKARGREVNLVVQSFLIHNGINTFGELVCMPGKAKDVAKEQGEQWQRQR